MILFEPIRFRKITLQNRLMMSPMCMFSSVDGMPNDFHLVHYGSHAMGGVGLVMVEATAVSPEGRITPDDLGLWNDVQAEALNKMVDFVHQNSRAEIGIQLAHAGRKASSGDRQELGFNEGGWETVAPSAIPYSVSRRIPHVLTVSEIAEVVAAFKNSAKRALGAGFKVIEIHAAHGYLLHQFLSPLSNQRTDAYGGSLENRARFLLEIVDAVNELLVNGEALFARISGDEYAEGGWDVNSSVALAKLLKAHHVDLVDVSSGGNIQGARINLYNGYQVPFASRIRREAGIKTAAVGLITDVEQAEDILQNDKADLIVMARELLRNPFFPIQNAMRLEENYFMPKQYEKAVIHLHVK